MQLGDEFRELQFGKRWSIANLAIQPYLFTPAPNRAKSYFTGSVGSSRRRLALRFLAARAMLRLEVLGLTEWFYRTRTRFHRLTRAAEDALLVVVAGTVAG